MATETLEEAACRGFRDAGFVDTEAFTETTHSALRPITTLSVSGNCPCGLGQSRMAVCWHPQREPPAEHVYHKFKAAGLKHIEQDRAEGRWVD